MGEGCLAGVGYEVEGVPRDASDRWAREGQWVVRHAAPGVDLVGVVRRPSLAALAAGNARQAVVPIATVGDEAIGRNWPVGFVFGG